MKRLSRLLLCGATCAALVVPGTPALAGATATRAAGSADVAAKRSAAASMGGAVLVDARRLAGVRHRIAVGSQPETAAWERMQGEIAEDLTRSPNPPTEYVVPPFYEGVEASRAAKQPLIDDANGAYRLALSYRLTGNQEHGRAAAERIDAWASTLQKVSIYDDGPLSFSYHFPAMVYAADLLRGRDVWSAEGEARFVEFLRAVALPPAESIIQNTVKVRWNNWRSWALALKASVATYLDDEAMEDETWQQTRDALDHQLAADGSMPQEIRRNNGTGSHGIWYTHFTLHPTFIVATLAERDGQDLWSYQSEKGATLQDATALVAGWAEDRATFPYYNPRVEDDDRSEMVNVQTIDYLREQGYAAHSISYFELVEERWDIPAVSRLVTSERPMTTIHATPFLSLTHGCTECLPDRAAAR